VCDTGSPNVVSAARKTSEKKMNTLQNEQKKGGINMRKLTVASRIMEISFFFVRKIIKGENLEEKKQNRSVASVIGIGLLQKRNPPFIFDTQKNVYIYVGVVPSSQWAV
jgi:hypothetical protein